MNRIIRAALTQTRNAYADMPTSTEDLGSLAGRLDALRDANLAHHRDLIAAAKTLDVKVLCMGELFTGPYFALDKDPIWLDMAEDASSGPSIRYMQEVANEFSMVLVAPIYELDASSGKRFNTAVLIEKDGSLLGKYRKTHIPEGTNDQGSFHETFYYQSSEGPLGNGKSNISSRDYFPVFESSVGKVGIAICYDRHFPGVMKALAEEGAEIVFSPAVTFGEKSRRMWEMEFPVDAARHNIYIGGSNRIGHEPPWSQEYFGASFFAGPNGRAFSVSAPEGLIVADLDLSVLSQADPSGWNLARDLRSDIY